MTAEEQSGTEPTAEATTATARPADEQPVATTVADGPADSAADDIAEEAVGEAVSATEGAVVATDEAAVADAVAEVATEVAADTEAIAVEAVGMAVEADDAARDAAAHARTAEAVAEAVLADPAMPEELVAEVVIEAAQADEVADEAAAEAFVASEVAEEAVVEALIVDAVAEEAVVEAAQADVLAGQAEVEAEAADIVAAAAVEATLDDGELAAAPQAEVAPPRDLGPEPTTMEELLSEQSGDIRSFKHGDVVEGTVVRIDKDEILVDIGAKSEGVVSNRELFGRNAESQPQLTIGDTVLVYVLQPESNEGHAVLSLRRAGLERKWRSMQEQFDAGVIIEAPVIDHNKGGLIVDCGIRGFVPISQIVDFPRRPQNDQPRDAAQEIAEKLQPFVGRKLRLKILEVNRKANRLILSEKVALYEERREKRDELFSSLQVGQKVTGTVRSIAPFGVFIDLGGIDGLVHKSELSWNKVNNPEAGYKVGDEVEAEVIDINHERGRISLSIRRLQPDPWHSTVADFKVGDIIDGTVTKIVNFGAFVRVREGLEGLIHISELSHQRVAHPADVVHEGQTLKLKIISLDSERHRLGLSLKQAEEAPPRPAPEPREARRPRPERSFDASQAVQEPDGGIDNTLAAAFAQVRLQMAAAEVEEVTETVAEAEAAEEVEAVAAATEIADAVAADEAVEEATAADAIDQIAEAVAADETELEEAAVEEIDRIEDAAAGNEANEEAATEAIAEVVQEVAEAEAVEEAMAAEAVAEIADAVTADEAREEAAAEVAVEGIVEALTEDEAALEAAAAEEVAAIAAETMERNTAG